MKIETAIGITVLCAAATTLAYLWSIVGQSIDRRIRAAVREELARRPETTHTPRGG